jgi:hypothetical protein
VFAAGICSGTNGRNERRKKKVVLQGTMDCLHLIIEKDANALGCTLYLNEEIGFEVLGFRLMVSPLIMGGEGSLKVE